MSQITPDILAKIASGTPHGLRDRFIPFMNEAMPRYDITTKDRVAAFLCTTCFESQYFQKTREGKARPGTRAAAAQSHYWSTGFFGRGILQVTHKEGYQLVGEYLNDKGIIDDPDLFVNNPELLEEPKWAVESACVYWAQNNLNRYADAKKIFALEGIVNTGNASHTAWGETDRETLYRKLELILPNDFDLSDQTTPATALAAIPATNQNDSGSADELPDTASTSASDDPTVGSPTIEQPPTLAPVQTADTIVNTGDVATPVPPPQDVTMAAPTPMGSVATSNKVMIGSIVVPGFIVTFFHTIQTWVSAGYISAADIGSTIEKFVTENIRYVFILAGLVIGLVIVKKILRELVFLVTVISHAIPGWNSITVVAPDAVPVTKPWYHFW